MHAALKGNVDVFNVILNEMEEALTREQVRSSLFRVGCSMIGAIQPAR